MIYKDLENKTEKELQELLMKKRNEVRELRNKVSENQLKDMSSIKSARRSIAQIMTALNNQSANNDA